MGDHRISIKIEAEFHGVTEKMDAWLNWSPTSSECDGVDQRIIDFFRELTERGMEKYNERIYELERKDREEKQRKFEIAELARLKAKYEP